MVEYLKSNDYKTHLKTLMWTTFKYVGMDNSRTIEHSDQVSAYLGAMKYSGVNYDPKLFDERVKEVKHLVQTMV